MTKLTILIKSILVFTLFFVSSVSFSQNVTCSELTNFIKSNGNYKSSISNSTLNSEWLYSVNAYSYNNQIFVIAQIKENQYSYQTKTYVFCGIPSRNWINFEYPSYGDLQSYGERFHKYIINYQCNCN